MCGILSDGDSESLKENGVGNLFSQSENYFDPDFRAIFPT